MVGVCFHLRSSEIHLFYNLGDFYWHFLEILWLFIFLFLYSLYSSSSITCAPSLYLSRRLLSLSSSSFSSLCRSVSLSARLVPRRCIAQFSLSLCSFASLRRLYNPMCRFAILLVVVHSSSSSSTTLSRSVCLR